MTRRHTWWLAGALVMLLLAVGAWFLSQSTDQRVLATVRATHAGQPVAAGPDTPASPLPAMPAQSTRLPMAIPALRARADAGDRRAACRLGFRLIRCQHAGAMNFSAMPGEDGLDAELHFERSGNLAAANQMAEQKLWHLEQARECRGVPQDLLGRGAHYLRAAARAGDPDAMLLYGQGLHMNPTGRGIAADPDFDAWLQEAPGMIHRAFRAGNPAAAFTLYLAYMDDFGFPSMLIPDDPYQVAVHHLLVNRLFGMRENAAWLARLDAKAQERARAEARQLHEDIFAGKSFDSEQAMAVAPYFPPRERQVEPCGDLE